MLKDKLKEGSKIVVTFAQYAIPPDNKFVDGAYLHGIYYYENGKYYDIRGKEVDLLQESGGDTIDKSKPQERTSQIQKNNELSTHYYFDINASEDSHNISLYYSEHLILIEKATELPKPLSESQYVGSISGMDIHKVSFPSLPTMENKNEITLNKGTRAQGDDVGVRWETDTWVFDVVGHSAVQYANELESALENSHLSLKIV